MNGVLLFIHLDTNNTWIEDFEPIYGAFPKSSKSAVRLVHMQYRMIRNHPTTCYFDYGRKYES